MVVPGYTPPWKLRAIEIMSRIRENPELESRVQKMSEDAVMLKQEIQTKVYTHFM